MDIPLVYKDKTTNYGYLYCNNTIKNSTNGQLYYFKEHIGIQRLQME